MEEKSERVQKIISNAGYCSRRKAEELIEKGLVFVNSRRIHLGDRADARKDEITVNGKKLEFSKKIYLIFNKPYGYLTTTKDPKNSKTIMRFIKTKERVYPVGRLDKDSEGLLILTNDGDFANKIMHPRYEINKTYFVAVDKKISDENIKNLEEGVLVEERKTSKAKVERLTEKEFNITIHEGRKRIIRKMLAALGYNVVRLIRISIGKLQLGDLKAGRCRELSEKEKELICQS